MGESTEPQAQAVLDGWFGAQGSLEYGRPRSFWFRKSEASDEAIRVRFGPWVEAALRGELAAWAWAPAARPREALALILLLDQFTRNLYRNSARAFAGDVSALAVARALVACHSDRSLLPVERWFVYLPFEHSEAAADQAESLRLFEALVAEGLPEALEWARRHAQVIERFGRYPHRNEALGRTSTAEELVFLAQPGSRF